MVKTNEEKSTEREVERLKAEVDKLAERAAAAEAEVRSLREALDSTRDMVRGRIRSN